MHDRKQRVLCERRLERVRRVVEPRVAAQLLQNGKQQLRAVLIVHVAALRWRADGASDRGRRASDVVGRKG
jgi:hypothetical protein